MPLVPTTSPTRRPFWVSRTMNATSLVMPSPPLAQPADRQFHQPWGALPASYDGAKRKFEPVVPLKPQCRAVAITDALLLATTVAEQIQSPPFWENSRRPVVS